MIQAKTTTLNYKSYLNLDKMLTLQTPLTNDNEYQESLFIIVHQSQELFFKQILLEIEKLNMNLIANMPLESHQIIKRVLMIFDTLTKQHDILGTMNIENFFRIRSILDKASGMQSFQFRKILFMLGIKNDKSLLVFKDNEKHYNELKRLANKSSTLDATYNFFYANKACNKDIAQFRTEIVKLYLNNTDIQLLVDALIDLDKAIQSWRYNHLKLVEKMIGDKHGTGNTSGAKFLSVGVSEKAFSYLWQLRADVHDYLSSQT